MTLSPEQLDFRDAIRDFADRECGTREQREQWLDPGEEDHSTPLYNKLADLGWLGVAIPDEFGGAGGNHTDQLVFFEEIYRGLVPVKGLGPTTTVAGCYARFGSDEQKASALNAIVDGAVMAISISEPGAGSDVAAVSCSARKSADGWVINGQKTWCSYAHVAERILLLARTSREDKSHLGLTVFEVSADTPGIETHRISTMGGREVNDIFFTDCVIPEDSVVGEVGRGFAHIMSGLDGERLLCAAVSLGIAGRALDDTLRYVRERRQFGNSIGSFQSLRHRLADHCTELECARLLTYEVARRMDSGDTDRQTLTRLTSMAKVKTSETAKQIALDGLQMMGGYGYATEYDMEGHVRHSLVLSIYAGANEVQRDIISGALGLR